MHMQHSWQPSARGVMKQAPRHFGSITLLFLKLSSYFRTKKYPVITPRKKPRQASPLLKSQVVFILILFVCLFCFVLFCFYPGCVVAWSGRRECTVCNRRYDAHRHHKYAVLFCLSACLHTFSQHPVIACFSLFVCLLLFVCLFCFVFCLTSVLHSAQYCLVSLPDVSFTQRPILSCLSA